LDQLSQKSVHYKILFGIELQSESDSDIICCSSLL